MNNIINSPSPNFDSRSDAEISLLVLHYTGMQSGAEALQRLCDEQAQVSSHYLIEENGDIYKLVDEEKRAWHAGVSYWNGNRNVNNISIGIEIVNPGHEFGYRQFPQIQMDSVLQLCKQIIKQHQIAPRNVVAHSDIAPSRKCDPGELFDWQFLAEGGVGLFPQGKSDLPPALPHDLSKYGYEQQQDELHQAKIIEAFQRRFRHQIINGVWDDNCGKLLAELLNML